MPSLLLYQDHKGFLTPCRNVKEVLESDPEAYYNNDELLEPLKLMYRSLLSTNDDGIANGRLLDVIRQAWNRFLLKVQ